MIFFDEDRPSDSPYIERVWSCHSEGTDPFLSIAASRCELVVNKLRGKFTVTMRGAETRARAFSACPGDGEWLGILLTLGTYMPHLPASKLLDTDVDLPLLTRRSFCLAGSSWELPSYDNADVFVARLVRKGLLVRDPVVAEALRGQVETRSLSTVQRRFVHATGLTQSAVRQIERARYATSLLQQGVSILDTVEQAGYYDQPHLTRALKFLIGQTPAQIRAQSYPAQMPFLYKTAVFA